MSPDAAAALPAHFTEWHPVMQAATLAGLTLVQEDLPTVSAALFSALGRISWQAGYFGCFLGIWLGDALLYLVARGIGRPLLEKKWAQRWVKPAAVARSEQWFQQRGIWLLVGSRFVPGTRLPTYLAAGFLRQSFPRFLLVTGVTVALWTLAIFVLAHSLGDELLQRFQRNGVSTWTVLAAAVLFVIVMRLAAKLAAGGGVRRFRAWAARWTQWEFWPAWLFYFPVGIYYLRLAVRHRGLTVPSAANPGIATGGLVGESKYDTLRDLWRTSPEATAQSWLLAAGPADARGQRLDQLLAETGLEFPFILKPDVGQRGMGVKLIRSASEATEYLRTTNAPVVVQRYVPGPLEVGIFYYRFPDETQGRIFAITEKIFPVLTGDGVRTVEELIWANERARCVAGRYLQRFDARRKGVLPAGTKLRLVEAGNHAQGCIFRDGERFLTPELTARIDDISRRLDGFFIGRYDLRFASEDDLRAGKNFQILELNGAAAEATSIYDARNSLRSAYRTLFRQWELVFTIGAANRARGVIPSRLGELWAAWRQANRLIAGYPLAD
jgi:membrane protein DedA with SNARE-associated domain